MTYHMAKKPTPWPALGVKLQLLRSSGASLTFRIVNRVAPFDASSPVTNGIQTPARILPFHWGRRGRTPKPRG